MKSRNVVEEINKIAIADWKFRTQPSQIFRDDFQGWWWINHSKYDQTIDEAGYVTLKYTHADLRDYFFEKVWKGKWCKQRAREYKFPKNYNKQIAEFIEQEKQNNR